MSIQSQNLFDVLTFDQPSIGTFDAPDPTSEELINYQEVLSQKNFTLGSRSFDQQESIIPELESHNYPKGFETHSEMVIILPKTRTISSLNTQSSIQNELDSVVSQESTNTKDTLHSMTVETSTKSFDKSEISKQKQIQEIYNQSQEQNSSEAERTKKYRQHLKNQRRKKGIRNQLQQEVKGYWTNNLLRWAKKYHLDQILEKHGNSFMKEHKEVYQVFNKINQLGKKMQGITMADYLVLYLDEDLEELWIKFFSKKILYRELMLSKADAKVKKVYCKFIGNFEKAFKTKTFYSLSTI